MQSMQDGPIRGPDGVVVYDRASVERGLAEGSIVLVDVREPHEFDQVRIAGSMSMPLSAFDPAALPREAGRPIVFSCVAGVRSLRAILAARAAGLDVDSHYAGGMKDWLSSGMPVESGPR